MSTVAEIELKFPVHDIAAFTASLAPLGFTLATPRTFEANTLYDTPDRALRARHQLLRLRIYGDRYTVTHKRLADHTDDVRYKTRIETESMVEDPAALAEIFTQLGYAPVFRYEKFRTEWVDDAEGHHLTLDETPIGTWAELEGVPDWIDATLARLGIDLANTLTDSYGRLFLAWRERTGSPASDLTFEACAAVPA